MTREQRLRRHIAELQVRKAREHWVYRLLNAEGRALYVGMTRAPRRRMLEHRSHSAWFPKVRQAVWTKHATYDEARTVERAEIVALRPVWNKNHADYTFEEALHGPGDEAAA